MSTELDSLSLLLLIALCLSGSWQAGLKLDLWILLLTAGALPC
jgi:hypothetical protein